MNINGQPIGRRLVSNISQIQFWLLFDKKYFSYKQKLQSSAKKVSKLYIFFCESTYPKTQIKHIPRVYEY